MHTTSKRFLVILLLVASLGLLAPGLFLPVLSIRGVLTRDGIASVAPVLLEKGLDEDTVAALESMMNPAMLSFLKMTGGNVRTLVIDKLGPQLTAALQEGVEDVEVYTQTRSIVGSVQNLYEVGSPVPATLILLFSVVVPLTKAALVAGALFVRDPSRRQRTLDFVEAIAKWSMADVFVVALFIAYLAAQATQAPVDGSAPLVAFSASFGPGSTGSPPIASSRWPRSSTRPGSRARRASQGIATRRGAGRAPDSTSTVMVDGAFAPR